MSSTRDLIIGRLVGKGLSCDPSCRGMKTSSGVGCIIYTWSGKILSTPFVLIRQE